MVEGLEPESDEVVEANRKATEEAQEAVDDANEAVKQAQGKSGFAAAKKAYNDAAENLTQKTLFEAFGAVKYETANTNDPLNVNPTDVTAAVTSLAKVISFSPSDTGGIADRTNYYNNFLDQRCCDLSATDITNTLNTYNDETLNALGIKWEPNEKASAINKWATDHASDRPVPAGASEPPMNQMSLQDYTNLHKMIKRLDDNVPARFNELTKGKAPLTRDSTGRVIKVGEVAIVEEGPGGQPQLRPTQEVANEIKEDGWFKKAYDKAKEAAKDTLAWIMANLGKILWYGLLGVLINEALCSIAKTDSGCFVNYPPGKGRKCPGQSCRKQLVNYGGDDQNVTPCNFSTCCGTCALMWNWPNPSSACTTNSCCCAKTTTSPDCLADATASVSGCGLCSQYTNPVDVFQVKCKNPGDVIGDAVNAIAKDVSGLFKGFGKIGMWIGIGIAIFIGVLLFGATIFGYIRRKFRKALDGGGSAKAATTTITTSHNFKLRFNKAHKAFSLKN